MGGATKMKPRSVLKKLRKPKLSYETDDSQTEVSYVPPSTPINFEKRVVTPITPPLTPEKSPEKAHGGTYDKSFGGTYDKSFGGTYDRTSDKKYNITFDKPYDKTFDKTHDKAPGGTYGKTQDKNYDKTFDEKYDKTFDKTYDKTFDKTHDKTFDKTYDKTFDKTFDKTLEQSHEKASRSKSPKRRPKPLKLEDLKGSVSRDGTPVISSITADHFRPSDVNEDATFDYGLSNVTSASPTRSYKKSSRYRRGRVVLKEAPSAKVAAFSGPPRYDWIDIETAAAVKVQSIFRRNQTMYNLERRGITTAYMRNRQRARKQKRTFMTGEDAPSALRFCGLAFLFGDATGEENAILEAHRKAQYEEKRRSQETEEEIKRKFRMRKKADEQLLESVEVLS